MNALLLLLLEVIVVAVAVLFLHRFRAPFSSGLLLIFLGSVQFYQTVLASSVYNEILPGIVVSPGSAVLFTSTFFCVLLLFHSEGLKTTRTAIFGVLFSNVLLSLLSFISMMQLDLDKHSNNKEYLSEVFNFDVSLFLTGSILLFLDLILIVMLYQLLNFKAARLPFFFKLYLPLSLIALFDSVVFYSVNFFHLNLTVDLLYSNLIGKQITILVFSCCLYLYLRFSKQTAPFETPQDKEDVISLLFLSHKNDTF